VTSVTAVCANRRHAYQRLTRCSHTGVGLGRAGFPLQHLARPLHSCSCRPGRRLSNVPKRAFGYATERWWWRNTGRKNGLSRP